MFTKITLKFEVMVNRKGYKENKSYNSYDIIMFCGSMLK